MPQYFQNFPYTTVSYKGSEVIVRDIIKAIEMTITVDGSPGLFFDYEMTDGERIENVSYNFYGSTQYHWVLIFINGIKDPLNDLPQRDYIIRQACADIYGNLDGVHHYENSNRPGEIIDAFSSNAYPITNIEFMTAENEKKRRIKILRPEYLSKFVSLYEDQISS